MELFFTPVTIRGPLSLYLATVVTYVATVFSDLLNLRFSGMIDQAWHLYKKYIRGHILTLETTLVTTYNTLCDISRLLYVINRTKTGYVLHIMGRLVL